MSFTHLAIQDTGMLYDLVQAQLAAPAFALPYTFCLTDLALASLDDGLRAHLQPYLNTDKIYVEPCDEADQLAVEELLAVHPRLQACEASVYHMARCHKWPMLASCKCLYTWEYVPPMQLLNFTWLLRELLRQAKLTKRAALLGVARLEATNYRLAQECAALRKLIGTFQNEAIVEF